MKKKYFVFLITCFISLSVLQAYENVFADYELGNDYFDRKDYIKAIKQYLNFWNNYTANINTIERNTDIPKDNNGIVKESYFSLYNTACCYSLYKNTMMLHII